MDLVVLAMLCANLIIWLSIFSTWRNPGVTLLTVFTFSRIIRNNFFKKLMDGTLVVCDCLMKF